MKTATIDGDMIAGKWLNNGEVKESIRTRMTIETLKELRSV
jgi:hypothetical protein